MNVSAQTGNWRWARTDSVKSPRDSWGNSGLIFLRTAVAVLSQFVYSYSSSRGWPAITDYTQRGRVKWSHWGGARLKKPIGWVSIQGLRSRSGKFPSPATWLRCVTLHPVLWAGAGNKRRLKTHAPSVSRALVGPSAPVERSTSGSPPATASRRGK